MWTDADSAGSPRVGPVKAMVVVLGPPGRAGLLEDKRELFTGLKGKTLARRGQLQALWVGRHLGQ